ncbi:DUF362 domain-containing protein [Paludisphaera sp.]|uniref:DUF362 domain-containing protein n=1 Tax=Paludisphaera sp. TaxID=2017432 RepID=UPI00301BC0BB
MHRCRLANAHRFDRRGFLQASAALGSLSALGSVAAIGDDAEGSGRRDGPGLPGAHPGRVVEVRHPGSCPGGMPDPEAVRRMVSRGITSLTGADDPVEAWRSLFARGEVVGIKVNPVGQPHAISNHATVHAIVEGLESAGIPRKDVVVFDRYKDQFIEAGYKANLPDGCRWDWAVDSYDEAQVDIARYDPDEFSTMEIVHARPGVHDPKDDRTRRSHLAKVLTRGVDKLICIPVLKDHGSGGVTLALKNMSHGLVNNVSRSHGTPDTNTCNLFIPAIVSNPVIRRKAVLQVLDGLNAVFQGGPGSRKEYVWQHETLFFATDPVAMDRIGWEVVDARRGIQGLPPVAEVGRRGKNPTGTEAFDYRQPQHIAGAGALGLGVYDRTKIDHRVVKLG